MNILGTRRRPRLTWMRWRGLTAQQMWSGFHEGNSHRRHCAFHVERRASLQWCMQAPQAGLDELARAHCPAYVGRFLQGELTEKEMRSIGFPWSEGLVRRSRASAGGTLAATRALFEWNLRITANIAGTSLSDVCVQLRHHCLYSSLFSSLFGKAIWQIQGCHTRTESIS